MNAENAVLRLNRVDQLIFGGLLCRQREVNSMNVALQRDMAEAFAMVEESLGLNRGSIGATHQINTDNMTVTEMDGWQPPVQQAVSADLE